MNIDHSRQSLKNIPLYKIDNRSELTSQIKHGDLIWIRQEQKLLVFDNGKLAPLAINPVM